MIAADGIALGLQNRSVVSYRPDVFGPSVYKLLANCATL